MDEWERKLSRERRRSPPDQWGGRQRDRKNQICSVTGNFTFANNESLKVLGTTVAILNGANYFAAASPTDISPKQLNPSFDFPRPV